MLQILHELLNSHVGISDQCSEETFLELSVEWNGQRDRRAFLTQNNMTANNSVNLPSSSNKSLDYLLTRNDWKFDHSYHDFNNPALLPKPFHSLFSQRFKTADNCLFDVIQSFFDCLALRVAAGQGWTADDIATLFSLLNNDFKLHGSGLLEEVDKGYFGYSSISFKFSKTNRTKSVRAYLFFFSTSIGILNQNFAH